MSKQPGSMEQTDEIAELRARLAEAEETLRAIRNGEVDAVVVSGAEGERVYTLESAELPYRVLVEQMQEGAATLSPDGIVLYANLRLSAMLGVPHGRLITTRIREYVSGESLVKLESLLRAGASEAARGEVAFDAGDGTVVPAYVAVSPLPPEVEGCVCLVVTDLTEQESMRRNQAEIQELNEQLRRAMRETHHRVKNNLQVIAGILDLRIMDGEETVPTDELRRVALHARTLAAVHDLLTQEVSQDEDTHYVSCRAVLSKLIELMRQTGSGRTFCTHLEDARVTARQGTSLALVVSEVIANAVKHGSGRVEVRLTVENGLATVEVCDNGAGFPEGFDVSRSANTGLELVEQVTRWDLSGRVWYQNRPEGGACVRLQMPTVR